ncbi:PREDICTED: RNA polymerase II elongation factor Ell [Nicrophorus vespilloides]|uniref:RNA polymerase II elongation factor Ell n=1 Tax=Nicrophorus vespilloides TaxID=110193 RepID=A0ABM1N6M7_NICVS|nr:PREDICTED: RNA polymerase II elongation factor Ell [Nicrophorus vespilloides]
MAALCPGVQYGLSSQESFGANKDLIFVKLTDSALRAIEDFVRNQNKLNKAPTIKFLGNEGQLSFPSHHNGNNSFNFSMSSTSDMEGPGGSLECVQQPLRGNLANLGPVQHKLRILANDDVYETTRQRMSVAEENHKNKCAREIKMNQTDIGRKVKVKHMPGRPVPPPPPRKETMSMRDALTKPYTGGGGGLPIMSNNNKSSPGSLNGLSNGLGSNQVSSSKPQNKPSIPDIAKRPIKERMIHMLALRPFKKIELYDRLTKDGLREKNAMMSVLKQIACLKDNSYHLNRAMWNDVHEDWPFYTDSERQVLKRRKPQNLTPPGSSDGGSSGSGHSPTSTHPGSPPLPVSSAVGSSTKRPGYFDGVDGLPTKKPRVSHFQKPTEQTSTYPQNNSQRRTAIDSRDTSNMNPRSRESPNTNGYHNNHHHNNYHEKRSISDEDDHHTTTTIATTTTNSSAITTPPSRKRETPPPVSHMQLNNHNNKYAAKEVLVDRTAANNGLLNGSRSKFEDGKKDRHYGSGRVSSSTQNKIARVSPDSQSDRIALPPQTDEFPDYVKEYTIIKDIEQRRRYKTDFNKHYEEYKELHGVVEKVSNRFTQLEGRLKTEDTSTEQYKDLQRQILREYQDTKKDREATHAKNRFQYLHDKLSHIKQLVFDYDQMYTDQMDIRY